MGRDVVARAARVRRARASRRGVRSRERAPCRRSSRPVVSWRPCDCCSPTPHDRRRVARLATRLDIDHIGPGARRISPPVPTAPSTFRAPPSATRTSSSSRAGARDGRRVSCSRIAPTGCARTRARRPNRVGAACVHVPAVPHGGLVDRVRRVAGPPTRIHFSPPTRRSCSRPCSATAPDASTRSRRCGRASSSTASAGTTSRRCARPTPARRRRHPSSSPRSATPLPHTVTRVFYGSTEAGPRRSSAHDDLAAKPGGVGRPQPGCDVRLSETGEVCVRSPFLMDGYFDNPEATAEALRDGWYHTGDLGAFDADGYLSIVGRARDVIRSGGETISPVEIEQVLAAHPAFAEVAVVGVPDPSWGEIVTARASSCAGPAPPGVDALRAWCSDRLASFKHPRRVVVLDALPRTPATGQVQRTLIVETDRSRPPYTRNDHVFRMCRMPFRPSRRSWRGGRRPARELRRRGAQAPRRRVRGDGAHRRHRSARRRHRQGGRPRTRPSTATSPARTRCSSRCSTTASAASSRRSSAACASRAGRRRESGLDRGCARAGAQPRRRRATRVRSRSTGAAHRPLPDRRRLRASSALAPLREAIVDAGGDPVRDTAAIHELAMGTMHRFLVERRTPSCRRCRARRAIRIGRPDAHRPRAETASDGT